MNEKKIKLVVLQDKIVVTKRRGEKYKKGVIKAKQMVKRVINATQASI